MSALFYWLGVVTFCLCALYGALEGGFWIVDQILKSFKLNRTFMRTAYRMIREDAAAKEAHK